MKEKWNVPKLANYDELRGKWNGCLMVNPLCPDDLCWLPVEGGKQHLWHCLGTTPWDHRFTIGGTAFYMSQTAVTDGDLVHEGWIKQLQTFPEEAEFRRQTNPELFAEAFPDHANQVQFLTRVRKGQEDENHPRNQARLTPNPTGRSHGHRSSLMNRTGGNKNKLYPCWCGETLTDTYRQYRACCWEYLRDHALALYLDLDTQAEYLYTQRRADGSEIGGEFALYVASDEDDWGPAEEDAWDLDEPREYWLDTWVLVKRQVRMLGPEPLEEDDDEPGADQGEVPIPDRAEPGRGAGVDEQPDARRGE